LQLFLDICNPLSLNSLISYSTSISLSLTTISLTLVYCQNSFLFLLSFSFQPSQVLSSFNPAQLKLSKLMTTNLVVTPPLTSHRISTRKSSKSPRPTSSRLYSYSLSPPTLVVKKSSTIIYFCYYLLNPFASSFFHPSAYCNN
jgi:hypothetical protein